MQQSPHETTWDLAVAKLALYHNLRCVWLYELNVACFDTVEQLQRKTNIAASESEEIALAAASSQIDDDNLMGGCIIDFTSLFVRPS